MFQLAYTNENLFEFNLHVCLKLNLLQKLQLMLILTLIITDTFSLLSLLSEYLHPMLSLKKIDEIFPSIEGYTYETSLMK